MLKMPPGDEDQAATPVLPTRGRDDADTSGSNVRDSVDRSLAATWTIEECIVHRQQLPDQP